MPQPLPIPSDVAFTDSVKSIQAKRGSRAGYARMERAGGWATRITDDVAEFIGMQTSFFLATSNAANQPYIQHRGGPAGFLRVLGDTTLAFADYRGNKQYITTGNLAENPKVHLFLIDYQHQQRVKIWGEARVVDDDPALLASLMPVGYDARPEQVVIIDVTAWDANCPQHIPQRFEAEDVAALVASKNARIAALEEELRTLRGGSGTP
ncbi:MAG: pyridoxamine 5'-phosphate oxidase family protein [Sandaracinaceae bacterium]|nr:pyridoxamine 5'-phosphate oxidase family protein [Sandaracinaceae bacterium]